MAALPNKLVFLALLVLAGNTLLPSPARAAQRLCDERRLPVPDTLSVEAAARKAAGGALPDIKVHQACIFGTTTTVWLWRPNLDDWGNKREWWGISCTREQSTWFKRGGWNCTAPEMRRGMDIEVSFAGKPRSVGIAFAGDVSFEAAEGLTRRSFAYFEDQAAPLQRCTTEDELSKALTEPARSKNPPANLSYLQRRYADLADDGLNTFITRQDQVLHLQPFAFDIGFAFEFPLSAVADPAHASGCWGNWFVFD